MTRFVVLAGALAAFAAPAAANAHTQPTSGDRANAAQECRYERGTTAATREAFAAKYRTFGACVSTRARDEAREGETAETNAAKTCQAERAQDRKAFEAKYGTNANKKNAFGKCVSQTARAQEDKADEADREAADARKGAAQKCATERGTSASSRQAFADKYGTNANKANAFGKCVSKYA